MHEKGRKRIERQEGLNGGCSSELADGVKAVPKDAIEQNFGSNSKIINYTYDMKKAFVVFALFFAQIASAQHIVYEIEKDDFTGETIILIQDQRKEGAYDQLAAQSHLFSDFLNWRVQLKSIAKQGDDRTIAIIFWAPNDDTYGGLYDADVIFKFIDGSTVKTKVGHYDFDAKPLTILDPNYTIYTLRCLIVLAPLAFVEDGIDKSGTLLNALSSKNLEAVRMYFGEGYVNFEVPDTAIFKKLLARLNALAPY
ncbi:MAG: hypothetical protein H6564_13840 [Lewinellaceae bacterium]|nr:hypothetical protein [Lewinellaceae bacterium]